MIDVSMRCSVSGTSKSRRSALDAAFNLGVYSLLAVDLTKLFALVQAVDRRRDGSLDNAARLAWQFLEGQSWPWLALLSACVLALHFWEASLPAPAQTDDVFDDSGTWW